MKKSIKTMICCTVLILALLMLGGAVYSRINTKTASRTAIIKENNEANCEDHTVNEGDETICFSSLEEYLQHLIDENEDAANSQITYYGPESVPSDAELVEIVESREGTSYHFMLGRDAVLQQVEPSRENDNVLSFTVGDTMFEGITQAAIVKYYGNNLNNVTDYVEFAENLAEDIGAPLISSDDILDIYAGNVYADIYDPATQIKTRYLVGSQRVFCMHMYNNPVTVSYSYVPALVTETEANLFTNMVEHTISTNNN